MSPARAEERSAPEPVVLGVRPGISPSGATPVRIFLASEPAQWRAERVFVWSVERVRDPSRVYEIHLMKGLSGFSRAGWTTGFTNYRFAIPHFAGGRGRAIYNDVDQIYLGDPGGLFDLDLGRHGWLGIAPDDPSVMLMDCEVMAGVWRLEDARSGSKNDLIRGAAATHGPLPRAWHARDGEYEAGLTRCLHYTNLHTQPWRPHPERFVYQDHPQAGLWHELERSADAAGFEVFTRESPSAGWRALARAGEVPALHAAPQEDVPWMLDERFAASAGQVLRERVACDPPGGVQRGPDGQREPRRDADWWVGRFERAAARHPGVRWEIELETPGSTTRLRRGGPRPDGKPPLVWVIEDDRPGNTTQSRGLAEALGWPYERRALVPAPLARLHNRILGDSRSGVDARRSDALEPPWPDLVIAAGRRTAPVARWIREQSAGATRLVQLGRKGADHADLFDLAVTPAYCRLFPHPRRLETALPLHSLTAQRVAQAREHWRDHFESLPRPRLVALVGGTSGQYRLDAAGGRALGEALARQHREAGGSLLVSTSRRTGAAATAALLAALGELPAYVYRPDAAGDNPYPGLLAWADAFAITGDSESMLAEAVSRGRPLVIHPLPVRRSFGWLRVLRDAVLERASARPPGPRGTGRPQRGLELLCARAIERGWVRPTRDLDLLHRDLEARGLATRFGAASSGPRGASHDDVAVVAARVRSLLGLDSEAARADEGGVTR